jgi:2-desacetyl-2-hydroxyethyl bacteriochlorophyllide A dehydrogenase
MALDARAVWFPEARVAEVRDEVVGDQLEPTELLIRAVVSMISAGTERNLYRGLMASPREVGLPMTRGEFPFPIKFGYQVVGRVERAGTDSHYRPGDLVLAQHPHQDVFAIDQTLVQPIPEGVAPRQAALANLCSVALNGLLDMPARIGDVVAVSGGGIVGVLAANLARRTASTLILVEPTERADGLTAIHGADRVVRPDQAVDVLSDMTDDRMADVWIEASGAPSALQTGIRGTGVEGTVVILSNFGSAEVPLVLSPDFHMKRLRFVSSQVGLIGSGLQPRWDRARRMAVAMQAVGRLDASLLISHEFPFARAHEAYQLIDDSDQLTMGVLLDYESGQ